MAKKRTGASDSKLPVKKIKRDEGCFVNDRLEKTERAHDKPQIQKSEKLKRRNNATSIVSNRVKKSKIISVKKTKKSLNEKKLQAKDESKMITSDISHVKNNKKTDTFKKVNDIIKGTAKLPQKSEEYSANWKAFQQAENITTKKKVSHKRSLKDDKKKNTPKTGKFEKPDIWFDDVDEALLEDKMSCDTDYVSNGNPLVKEKSYDGLTNTVAMDCEMVGVGEGGNDSILARVSIVNVFGKCIYDKYVKPSENVTDYRTPVSGIRKHDIEQGVEFKMVQKEVHEIIKNRILVGHAIRNDLQVLYLGHPKKMIRDTLRYRPFRKLFGGRNPSLKKLTAEVLGVSVQEGEHSSVQDAQAAMRLYTMHKKAWEKELSIKYKNRPFVKKKKKKKTENVKIDIVRLQSDSD